MTLVDHAITVLLFGAYVLLMWAIGALASLLWGWRPGRGER